MRSRQTGQVGSSTREGVGGARGLLLREVVLVAVGLGIAEGVKGSLVMSGKDISWEVVDGVRKEMDLTKTT